MGQQRLRTILLENISQEDYNLLTSPHDLGKIFDTAFNLAFTVANNQLVLTHDTKEAEELITSLKKYSQMYERLLANVRNTINWHPENVD